jgi:hypothetical protein
MIKLERKSTAYDFSAEIELGAGKTEYIEVPLVSINKKGVIDIGWQSDDGITLYGTLSKNYNSKDTLWDEMSDGEDVNRTVRYLKAVNTTQTSQRLYIRIILC